MQERYEIAMILQEADEMPLRIVHVHVFVSLKTTLWLLLFLAFVFAANISGRCAPAHRYCKKEKNRRCSFDPGGIGNWLVSQILEGPLSAVSKTI